MGIASKTKDVISDTKEFAVDSVRFLNKCQKPDKKGTF